MAYDSWPEILGSILGFPEIRGCCFFRSTYVQCYGMYWESGSLLFMETTKVGIRTAVTQESQDHGKLSTERTKADFKMIVQVMGWHASTGFHTALFGNCWREVGLIAHMQ